LHLPKGALAVAVSSELIYKINEHQSGEEVLDLSGNGLTEASIRDLSQALKDNRHIKRIDLSRNDIGNNGVVLLLKACPNLIELNLSNNHITKEGTALAFLASNSSLKFLDLSANDIGDGITNFVNNESLEELDLEECGIKDAGAEEIFRNKNLKRLNLASNGISDAGLTTLPQNTTLKVLSLHQNRIALAGAVLISQNETLRSVDLFSNNLGPDGAAALAKNNKIEALYLGQNGIGNTGVANFGSHASIERLGLFNNEIDVRGIESFAKNEKLCYLDLTFNQLDPSCLSVFASVKNLTELFLSGNEISSENSRTLLSAFKKSKLESLELDDVTIDCTERSNSKKQKF